MFDRAVVAPAGRHRVLYGERGTKALLLADRIEPVCAVYDLQRAAVDSSVLDGDGRLVIACGERVVALYETPRMVEPATGEVLAEWPGVEAGHVGTEGSDTEGVDPEGSDPEGSDPEGSDG
jgi:hypothetical protein